MPDIEDVAIYLYMFQELSTMRQVGMSLGPIPFDKILLYCEFHELDFSVINLIIRAIDNEFLRYVNEKESSKKDE